MIYLDNAATTFPKPQKVYEALDYANRNLAFNAGRGNYKKSLEAQQIIENCKSSISNIIGKNPEMVAFSSSATESLNLIINGLDLQYGDTVYISPFEHNAIIRPLYNLQSKINFNIEIIPFNKTTWKIDVDTFKNQLAINKPKAVFMSHISNVTGYILPYEEAFEMSKKYGSINILDCAQSFGLINPNIKNVDFIVFAGHKSLYASFGVAGFINIGNVKLKLTKTGGNGSDSLNHYMPESGNERYESGSQNVVAIYGLLKSIEWLKSHDILTTEKKLTDFFINKLKKYDKIKIYIPDDISKILGIISFNVEGYRSEDVSSILSNEFDICTRSGYHCSPFIHDFLDTKDYGGTVRVSLGAFNTEDDINALLNAIATL